MAVRASTATKNTLLNALRTKFANGVIQIYGNAAQPARGDEAPAGTLLGVATLNAGTFTAGNPTNGLNFAPAANGAMDKPAGDVWQFKGIANGIASYARMIPNAADPGTTDNSATYDRLDGRIGPSGSGAEVLMANTEVTVGATSTIDSWLIDWPPTF